MRLARPRLVLVLAWIAGALLVAPAAARADALPFSQGELADALRVRVAAHHRVEIAAAAGAAGAIAVTVDGRTATVVLGDERGPDAARVVALVAAELALTGAVSAAPSQEPPSIARVAAPADAGLVRTAAPPGRRWSLGARAIAPIEDGSAPAFGLIGAIEDGGVLRWSFAGGAELQGVGLADGTTMRVLAVPIRVGVGLGARRAIGVSAIAAALFTDAGAGATSVVLGGGLHARAIVDVPAIGALALQGGVDVMANQVEYRWDDATVLVTGRIRPWIAVGLTWEEP